MARRASPLWAITSYFNPLGYSRRRSNYRAFRQRLQAPLVAVEHSFDGRFELRAGDADILIQCAGGGVMWQKERLLNVAARALPASCRYVAWVDCDVVFQNAGWAQQVERALQRAPLVQPFAEVHYLQPAARLSALRRTDVAYSRPSAARRIVEGLSPDQCLGNYRGPQVGARAAGLAWACRREVLEQHGLYDACIIGGGGLAVVAAAYGVPDVVVANHRMNQPQANYYRAWADRFHSAIGGDVGCTLGDICHLWHGDPAHRQTNQRHAGLAPFAFDPAADIAVDDSGCWRWNSDKPQLHDYLHSFFANRREDAAPVRRPAAASIAIPASLNWRPASGLRVA
jgi:hypothetical protein